MTIYFEWTKDLSVGNEVIDTQHKQLLTQVNKIIDAVSFGVEAKEVQDSIIPFFDKYIKEHFSYEEEYMKKINYPFLKKHIKEHHNFIKNYIKFKEKFDKGVSKQKLLLEIEKFIGTWWINHIEKEDKNYQLFFKKNKNN